MTASEQERPYAAATKAEPGAIGHLTENPVGRGKNTEPVASVADISAAFADEPTPETEPVLAPVDPVDTGEDRPPLAVASEEMSKARERETLTGQVPVDNMDPVPAEPDPGPAEPEPEPARPEMEFAPPEGSA